MKKVLVLASLGLLALSFGCGGSDNNNEEDAAIAKGQSAFVFNSMIPAIVDGTEGAIDQRLSGDSVHVNIMGPVPLTPIPLECPDGGDVEVTGTTEGELLMSLNFNFNACSIEDPFCETGQKVTADGDFDLTLEVTDMEENVSITFDTSLIGTLTFSGLFEKSCDIELSSTGTQVDISGIDAVVPEPKDFGFTGTVCEVDIQDIVAIEEAEREELCQTL